MISPDRLKTISNELHQIAHELLEAQASWQEDKAMHLQVINSLQAKGK